MLRWLRDVINAILNRIYPLLLFLIGFLLVGGIVTVIMDGPSTEALIILPILVCILIPIGFRVAFGVGLLQIPLIIKIKKRPEIQSILKDVSSNNTDRVYVGFREIKIVSFPNNSGNNGTSSTQSTFSFASHGYKSLKYDEVKTIGLYIGMTCFDNKFKMRDWYQTDGPAGGLSDHVVGINPDAGGSGYAVSYSSDGYSSTLAGIYVQNTKYESARDNKKPGKKLL